mgnify:CR=1 FL=1
MSTPTASEMVAFYVEAEQKVLSGLEVRMGDRMLKRADLAEIRAGRREWESKLAAQVSASRGSSGFRAASFSS